jgi:hypothetical protein
VRNRERERCPELFLFLKGKKMTDNFFPVSGWASDETFQRLQGDHGDQEIVQVSERNAEGNNLKRNIKKYASYLYS